MNSDSRHLTKKTDQPSDSTTHPFTLSRSHALTLLRFTLAALALSTLAGPARADWPQFLGPARNGTYSGPALTNAWPKEGPMKVWQKPAGEGFSGPVVASGTIILFHRLDDKEAVECLNATDGSPLWKQDYPTSFRDEIRGEDNGPRATPLIEGGVVYTFGAEGMLHCWNLANGEKKWSVDTRAKFSPPKGFFGMACSPLIEGSALLLNIGGRNGAGIVAFNKDTGKVLWQATDDEASYSSPVAANIGGKRYVFFFTRKHLTAIDPSNGKIAFEFPWTPQIHASVSAATPLVIGDRIFISASYGAGAALLQFKETGPEKVWSGDDILSNHYATSVHYNGFLYGFDGRQEQGCNLRCVEVATGKIRWTQDGFGAGSILLAGDQFLILTEKGELIRAPATPAGFKPSAQAQILPFTVRAYPALANGFLYARSKDKLACFDLSKH